MNYIIPPRICFACMREYNNTNNTCPYCGYVHGTPQEDEVMLAQGTVLQGKYLIGKAIGRGGFGITYVGYNLILKQKIAIKEFFPRGYADRKGADRISVVSSSNEKIYEKSKKRFITEAQTLANFNAVSGIVSIYDCFEENGTAYIVMEYLEGMTLDTYKKTVDKMDFETVKRIASSVCDTLALIHSRGIIHRDISPDNIFYCNNGEIKLIDFGTVKQSFSSGSESSLIIVKHGYTPIEQYSDTGHITQQSDIYSLGATIYFLLTDIVIQAASGRICDDKVVPLAQIRKDVTENFSAAVMKAISINAADRFSSADEFKRAMMNYDSSTVYMPTELLSQPVVMQKDIKPEKAEESGKKRKLIIPIAVLGIVLIIFAVVFLAGGKSKKDNKNDIGVNNTESKDVSDENKADSTQKPIELKITAQPEDQSGHAGDNIFFKVGAEGEELTYQWQTSKDGGATWVDSNLDYYFTSRLMVVGTLFRSGYKFRCVIRDKDGNEIISEPATLTIIDDGTVVENDEIIISTQPTEQKVNLNDPAQFSVVAEGTKLKYKWQASEDGGENWDDVDFKGSGSSQLTVCACGFRNGLLFRCVVTNASGMQQISDSAALNIENLDSKGLTVYGNYFEPDLSMFGLGQQELVDKYGIEVSLEPWIYTDEGLSYCDYQNNGKIFALYFKNDVLSGIRHDMTGVNFEELMEKYKDCYGLGLIKYYDTETNEDIEIIWEINGPGGKKYYLSLFENEYDGVMHVSAEWRNEKYSCYDYGKNDEGW